MIDPAHCRAPAAVLALLWALPIGAVAQTRMTSVYLDNFEAQKITVALRHITRTDVAGHSLGSIVAQTFAEQWPDATRRLVLISSTGTSFEPAEPAGSPVSAVSAAGDWLAPVAKLADPIDPDSAFMRDWWKVSIAYNPQFARRQMHDSAAIPARVWRSIADQSLIGVNLQTLLPRIQAPTLLIWGARDTLVSDAGRRALRSGIPHVEERTFASLGHDLFWEDPPAVAGVMIGFLERR